MEKISSLTKAEEVVRDYQIVMLYFSRNECGVCDAIRPKVEQLLASRPRIRAFEINAEETPEAAAQYSIFTIPGILLFILGKESIREARYVSIEELTGRIDRYLDMLPEQTLPGQLLPGQLLPGQLLPTDRQHAF